MPLSSQSKNARLRENQPAAKSRQTLEIDTLLPHDRMAEQAVLGAVIINNNTLPQILDILTPDDFFSPANQRIFEAMREMSVKEPPIPIDEVTLSHKLIEKKALEQSGGIEYLLELAQTTPVYENADFYADIVRQKGQLRDIILTAHEVAKRGQEETSENISEFIAEATDKLQAIEARTSLKSYSHLKELLVKNFDELEKLSESPEVVSGVPTGFSELDEMTRGLQPGDLIILAARPSMGKTALAMNVALHASAHAQIPSLIFSLEMPKEQIAMRMVCSEAKVNNRNLLTGKMDRDDWDKLMDGTTRMMDAPLLIDDRPAISPNYMRQVIRQALKEMPSLGLIVVDYLQLMKGNQTTFSREQEISDISRSLKAIAKEFSLPVLALSQLNRGLEKRPNKRPMMSDLRESGALEQDADLILFIYREEVYNKETDDKGIAEISIAKHRNGEIGMKRLAFIAQYTKFANLAADLEPTYS